MGNCTIETLVAKFQTLEERILAPNTTDIEAWYDIRFNIFSDLTIKLGLYETVVDKPVRKKTIITKIKKKLQSIQNTIIKSPLRFVFNRKPYIFFSVGRRKQENEGLFWDIYTDPITTGILKNQTITIEQQFNRNHFRPVPTKNIAYFESLDWLKGILYPKSERIVPESVLNIFKRMQTEINTEFNVDLDIVSFGKKKFISNKINESILTFLFRILKPKAIFLICSYGREYIVRAARKLGIPSIEIQHGVLNRYHVGYSFSSNIPKMSFPDYLFTFGDYWNTAADFPIPLKKIFSVGYPYLEETYHRYRDIKKKQQVLFISQGTIGDRLSDFAAEFAELNPGVDIIYKLHPREVGNWEKNYSKLQRAEERGLIKVISGHDPGLYELFAQSTVQIGVYSTAIFEGIFFGCKTFLVNLPGIEYMKDFISSGIAALVNRPQEIKINVHGMNGLGDKLFDLNWKDNFTAALNQILKKKTMN